MNSATPSMLVLVDIAHFNVCARHQNRAQHGRRQLSTASLQDSAHAWLRGSLTFREGRSRQMEGPADEDGGSSWHPDRCCSSGNQRPYSSRHPTTQHTLRLHPEPVVPHPEPKVRRRSGSGPPTHLLSHTFSQPLLFAPRADVFCATRPSAKHPLSVLLAWLRQRRSSGVVVDVARERLQCSAEQRMGWSFRRQ